MRTFDRTVKFQFSSGDENSTCIPAQAVLGYRSSCNKISQFELKKQLSNLNKKTILKLILNYDPLNTINDGSC